MAGETNGGVREEGRPNAPRGTKPAPLTQSADSELETGPGCLVFTAQLGDQFGGAGHGAD